MKKADSTINLGAIQLTHFDKIYFPKEKITKGQVIEYYHKMAPYILPHLKDRPEILHRFPHGISSPPFYQKNVIDPPEAIKTVQVKHKEGLVNYIVANNEIQLLYMVNLGCIEIHPLTSRYETIEYPDYIVIDLDPEDIDFKYVVEAARGVHELLEEVKIPSYCKTSGATGIHIYIPMAAKYNFEQAKEFCHLIVSIAHSRMPKFTSLERSPKNRQKKVYLDFLQNNRGQSLASAYSLRPRPGATVSTPLEWKEVNEKLDPKEYNIFTIFDRVVALGDIFLPVIGKGINLEKCLDRLNHLL